MEEVKYNRKKLSTRNFNYLDWFAFYAVPISIAALILSWFVSIWIDYPPVMFKVIWSLIFIMIFGLLYARTQWMMPSFDDDNTRYHEEYSELIEETDKDL